MHFCACTDIKHFLTEQAHKYKYCCQALTSCCYRTNSHLLTRTKHSVVLQYTVYLVIWGPFLLLIVAEQGFVKFSEPIVTPFPPHTPPFDLLHSKPRS